MSEEARIGRRWTLVIPKEIRERAGLREGQRVLVRMEGEDSHPASTHRPL